MMVFQGAFGDVTSVNSMTFTDSTPVFKKVAIQYTEQNGVKMYSGTYSVLSTETPVNQTVSEFLLSMTADFDLVIGNPNKIGVAN